MTPLQMQAYFELEIDKIDELVKPESEDIFYFINQATLRFVKTRYSGINYKREGFEQSQKRMDDLRTLVKEAAINTVVSSHSYEKPNSYRVDLTSILDTYFVTLAEEVLIRFTNTDGVSVTSREGITECTLDTYQFKVRDPLESHNFNLNSAWPLRLFIDGAIYLISDGSYNVTTYYITYLKLPAVISIHTNTSCDLPLHTHEEIIKLAVDMYLENISDRRVNTYQNEVNTME